VGLSHRLKVGSVVGLRYHQEEGRYRVVRVRRDGETRHWQVGVRLADQTLWGVELGCGLEPEDCRQMLKQALRKVCRSFARRDRALLIPVLGKTLGATLVIFWPRRLACRLVAELWLTK